MKKIYLAAISAAVILIVISIPVLVGKKGIEPCPPAKKAALLIQEDNLIEARRRHKEAMSQQGDANKLKELQKKLEEINLKIIFSRLLDEYSSEYIVKPKDALSKIAREFNTTVELIKRANSLNSDTIRPGQKLKVNTSAFSMVVDKSQNLLFLKRKDEVVKTYVVATGKDNSTPAGNFKITVKLANPTWYKTGAVIAPDSAENILGSRWMGFDLKGYGIHGTTEPDNLGKQVTLGCVRMNNQDAEELFGLVPPGTEVTIVD